MDSGSAGTCGASGSASGLTTTASPSSIKSSSSGTPAPRSGQRPAGAEVGPAPGPSGAGASPRPLRGGYVARVARVEDEPQCTPHQDGAHVARRRSRRGQHLGLQRAAAAFAPLQDAARRYLSARPDAPTPATDLEWLDMVCRSTSCSDAPVAPAPRGCVVSTLTTETCERPFFPRILHNSTPRVDACTAATVRASARTGRRWRRGRART